MLNQQIPAINFKPGDIAHLVHMPTRNGSEIIVPVTVMEVLRDGYVIDTPNQKGIKVRLIDLRPG